MTTSCMLQRTCRQSLCQRCMQRPSSSRLHPRRRANVQIVRSIGFERLDKDTDLEEDEVVEGYKTTFVQPYDVGADEAPMNPDEDDPEISELLKKLQLGELPAQVDDEDDEELGEDLSPEEVQQIKQVEEMMRRKSEILISLLQAGGQVSEKMEEIKSEIDPLLLQLLEGRIETAREVGEPEVLVDEMNDLLRLLKRTMQRGAASPALRLLDDLLAVLGGAIAGEQEYPPRRLEASSRMYEAFTGQASGVDIFEAAAALAEDSRAAGEMLTTEFVFLEEFMAEVLDLLNDAEEQQRQLADAIRRQAVVLRAERERGAQALATPEMRRMIQEVAAGKEVYGSRKRTIQQIQDIMIMARELEMKTSPARQVLAQMQMQ